MSINRDRGSGIRCQGSAESFPSSCLPVRRNARRQAWECIPWCRGLGVGSFWYGHCISTVGRDRGSGVSWLVSMLLPACAKERTQTGVRMHTGPPACRTSLGAGRRPLKGTFMDALFGKTIEMLSAVLDFRLERHKVIASNIANIDTPGYRPKDIVFKEQLEAIISNKEKITMAGSRGRRMSEQSIPAGKSDFEVIDSGEKVNLDSEMAKLTENNLMYNLTVELLARKFRSLNTVLREAK